MIICTNKDFEKVLNERAEQFDTTANARDFIADYVYNGNSNYLWECADEFADGNVDVYTIDLLDWLNSCCNAIEWVEEAIDCINPNHYDFTNHLMMAQSLANRDELQCELEEEDNLNWLKLWSLSLAERVDEITPDIYDDVIDKALDVDVDVNNDRIDLIIDIMNDIICDCVEG